MKHVILGAGGSIGNTLADELLKQGQEVRLVSRSGFSMAGAETLRGDLMSFDDMKAAVKGRDTAFLCAGLPYDRKIWAAGWPLIMKNAIDACEAEDVNLVFFDNVYMYGRVEGKMTEETPYNPHGAKGEIRANIAVMLEEAMKAGRVTALIARAADLYGPHAGKTSIPYIMAIANLMKGKKAQWLVNVDTVHSYTYTLDCARGLYLLVNRNESWGRVWHLPTFSPPIDGKTFIELAAREIGVEAEYSVLKKWMMRAAGLLNQTVGEVHEMLYQNEFDYWFDSSKFESFFNYRPVPYAEGIKETVAFFRQAGS